MNPTVSIIVPNYNHANYLEKRLESIFSQSFQDFEVILMDDLSTDESVSILSKYINHPKVSHLLLNNKNSGSPFKQWNKGIELAKGEFIWIAESDDYCEENFLSTLLKCHRDNPEIALAYSQSYRVNSEGEVKGTWLDHTAGLNPLQFEEDFVLEGNYFIEKYLIHKNVIPNVSGVLFKKKALQNIYPLKIEPYLKYTADWFYYIQLLSNSKVAFIAEPLNCFRFHPKSVIATAGSSSGWLKIFKMELKVRSQMVKHLEAYNLSNVNAIKQQAKFGNDLLYYYTATGYINRGDFMRGLWIALWKPKILKDITRYVLRKRNQNR